MREEKNGAPVQLLLFSRLCSCTLPLRCVSVSFLSVEDPFSCSGPCITIAYDVENLPNGKSTSFFIHVGTMCILHVQGERKKNFETVGKARSEEANTYVRYCSTRDTGETQNREQGLKLTVLGLPVKI